MSDRESGKRPSRREKAYPELQDGMSAFSSLEAAREIWATVCEPFALDRSEPVRAGYYIAEVRLTPEMGIDVEDLEEEPGGHVTVWGPAETLARSVATIYPAKN